jgi:hypothetical protein
MNCIKYKNRYGDVFTFTETEDGNVLWEGNFEYHRCSYPNVYMDAYRAYLEDEPSIMVSYWTLKAFKEAVHEYQYGEDLTSGSSDTMEDRKYAALVYSDRETIDMVDPSGGPYLSAGYDLGHLSDEFQGKVIQSFESVEKGYLIKIK